MKKLLLILCLVAVCDVRAAESWDAFQGASMTDFMERMERLISQGDSAGAKEELARKPSLKKDKLIELMRSAVMRDQHAIMDALFARGVDVDWTDERGDTWLRLASYWGSTETAKKLISLGAKVNSGNGTVAGTPLMSAAQAGKKETVDLLLEHGADVNATDDLKGTPLMRAAYYGHSEIMDALGEAGADEALQDFQGATAADWFNKR